MQTIQFTIPGVPVSQPRARATMARSGRPGAQHARVYNPPGPIDAFKALTRLAASQAFTASPLTGPLRVDSVFVFPRTVGQIWKRKPMPRIWHAKKPDRDNLDKAILDAMTGVVWLDDAQVCDGRLTKWIAAGDEQPHVMVTITVLDA